MKMIVDYKNFKIIGLCTLILILWYNTQVVYSYLSDEDEEFRFKSQREKNQERSQSFAHKSKDHSESFGSINPADDHNRIGQY